MRLAGRTVLVTGASRGIGLACARALAMEGADLVLAARGADELAASASALEAETGRRVQAVPGDCSHVADVARMVEALGAMADTQVAGVVHAAAVLEAIGPALDVDANAWAAVVQTNLLGAFHVAQGVGRLLRARDRGGSMVLFSGGGGTGPFPNYTAYACSKAAVVRLAETMAIELQEAGIRVNSLAPGFVATRMHEATLRAGGAAAGEAYLQRTRDEIARGGVPPDAAAQAACFLMADDSRGITGRLLAAVHDNWTAWPGHVAEISASDLFTVRRIVPRDRGLAW